jgi:hypothetical protein
LEEHAIRPSRRLSGIIERAMSLDPNDRYADMRALGQELLTLAGQRTRITWGLTFGEVAAAARARHALGGGDHPPDGLEAAADKPVWRWPLIAAAVVGLAALGLVVNRSTRQETTSALLPPSYPNPVSPAKSSVQSLQPGAARPVAEGRVAPGNSPEPVGDLEAARERRRDDDRGDAPRTAARVEPDDVRADPPRRNRPRPPRVSRVASPPPEVSDAPDWVIEQTSAAQGPRFPRATRVGTNDAPIFD